MNILIPLLFALSFTITPFFLKGLGDKMRMGSILSDVVVCFGIGLILGNTQRWWLPNGDYQAMAFSVAEVSAAAPVLLAIPMLLMTSDIRDCLRFAPKFLLSFLLCIIAVICSTIAVVYAFPSLENLGQAVGCMVGVYVGGTPNMVAISYALDAPKELFLILNSTDLFCSGIYFLFLTSFAKPFFSLFLRPFIPTKKTSSPSAANIELDETKFPPQPLNINTLKPLGLALLMSIFCIGISIGIAFLFPTKTGDLNELLLMIVLTTLSIFASFSPKIQSLKGVYEFAQYLLLIFAIAVGFMADFTKLANVGTTYLIFNAAFVCCLLFIHFVLAIIFRIDTDTFIMTSTACIFGPPFIGQVVSTIKNKEMLAPGMALGVLGLVVGTYLGILVASIIGYT